MAYAAQLFNEMSEPNSFVWNTIIRGFQQNHEPRNVLLYFDRMRVHCVPPDQFTFPFLIRACANLKDLNRGVSIHGQLFKFGVDMDVFVGTSLIDFYSAVGYMKDAQAVFDELPVKDKIAWTAILSGYAHQCGDMERARELFDQMPMKDLVVWNIMVNGYVKVGRINEAMRLFHDMQIKKVSPNGVTLVSLLSACAQVGALDRGRWLHSYIDRNKLDLDAMLGTALVDMYSKCGDLVSAVYVFDRMLDRDVVAWNAVIMGFSMNGQSRRSLEFFHQMKQDIVRPNDVTILAVLCACVHAGLVDEGRKIFKSKCNELGLAPKLEHYGCMVDLLGRAGLLDEAYEVIKAMPLEPHTGVWGALLSACKIHGNVELAEQAIKHIVQLDLEDGGYLAIMSNIYANAGRWDDVAKVREVMREKRVNKLRGCSSIEVNGEIHEFGVEDKIHPRAEEIYNMIYEISKRLRIAGHVSSTGEVFFDVEEEEKEKALYFHSEKMAVAFGLLATDEGAVIRVVKNLRCCSDCHAAIKLISKIFEREIVVRDRNRFHHFKEGSCSCGDYW
ncbi:hypothetical protein NMG60_11034042 [Bertholletia excelsa]